MEYQSFSQMVVSFALVLPRIAAAFLLLPYFSSDTIPPLLRNIFFVSLALAVTPLVLDAPPAPTLTGTALIPIVLKEIFIGVCTGYAFGIIFWALQGAGEVLDSKIGTMSAQLMDPVSGQQTTLLGAYLGRLAAYLFAACGGLHVFVDLLMSSFSAWPILDPLPNLQAIGQLFYIQRFDELMRLVLLLAAPALSLLTLLEVGLGFANRYAPQLNVFTLSMSLKGWVAVLVLLLTLGTVVDFIVDWLANQSTLLEVLPFGR